LAAGARAAQYGHEPDGGKVRRTTQPPCTRGGGWYGAAQRVDMIAGAAMASGWVRLWGTTQIWLQ
jgi:hypothetical protein